MSADNWAVCPRCLTTANTNHTNETARVNALYGTVAIDEFDRARDALKPVNPEDYRTFREDYEFYGAEDGVITADYGGGCGKCGLETAFKIEHEFWPPKPEAGV